MTPAALLLTALLAAPPAGAEEPGPGPAGSRAVGASTLVVRARGLDEDALQHALRPRSGGAAVVLLRDIDSVDPDHTFVDLDLRRPDLTITIILRDGRVFVRRAPAPAGPRDAARLVASMLVAIEGDALAPLPERATSPVLAELAEHRAEDSPARDVDAPLEVPVRVPEPALVPEPAPAPAPVIPAPSNAPPGQDMPVEPAPAPPPVPTARWIALDLGLGSAPIIGLGVPDVGLRGAGGDVRLDLHGDRPWLVSLAVRAAGNRSTADPGMTGTGEPFGLLRVRVSLGAGVSIRRGRLELRATLGLSVEPWLVSHHGGRVRLGDGLAPAPLLGGLLRLAPALAMTRRVRLGVLAELAASAAPSGRAVQVLASGAPLFTLGGLEASLGLELRATLGSWRRSPAEQR